jgi:hypothetical protein
MNANVTLFIGTGKKQTGQAVREQRGEKECLE